jgi:hypothetical protein
LRCVREIDSLKFDFTPVKKETRTRIDLFKNNKCDSQTELHLHFNKEDFKT